MRQTAHAAANGEMDARSRRDYCRTVMWNPTKVEVGEQKTRMHGETMRMERCPHDAFEAGARCHGLSRKRQQRVAAGEPLS
jgi:hypothetical protein